MEREGGWLLIYDTPVNDRCWLLWCVRWYMLLHTQKIPDTRYPRLERSAVPINDWVSQSPNCSIACRSIEMFVEVTRLNMT